MNTLISISLLLIVISMIWHRPTDNKKWRWLLYWKTPDRKGKAALITRLEDGQLVEVRVPRRFARVLEILSKASAESAELPIAEARGWKTYDELSVLVGVCNGYEPEPATMRSYLSQTMRKIELRIHKMNPGLRIRLLEREAGSGVRIDEEAATLRVVVGPEELQQFLDGA